MIRLIFLIVFTVFIMGCSGGSSSNNNNNSTPVVENVPETIVPSNVIETKDTLLTCGYYNNYATIELTTFNKPNLTDVIVMLDNTATYIPDVKVNNNVIKFTSDIYIGDNKLDIAKKSKFDIYYFGDNLLWIRSCVITQEAYTSTSDTSTAPKIDYNVTKEDNVDNNDTNITVD